jgi:hypothetical protein
MRIDLSGVIRNPVPTGILVSHVGLRRPQVVEQRVGAEASSFKDVGE